MRKLLGRLFTTNKEIPNVAPAIDNSKDERLELCFTDIQGNKFFKWKHPASMPGIRHLAGWRSIEYAGMGVDEKSLLTFIADALTANKDGDKGKVGYTLLTLRGRIEKSNPTRAYMELAAVYSIMNDEDPNKYSPAITQKKLEVWNLDLKAHAFFLNFAYKISRDLINTSNTDTPIVLATQATEMMNLLLTMQKMLFSQDTTTSTSSTGRSVAVT